MTGKIDFLNGELTLAQERTKHLEKLIKEYKPTSPFKTAVDRVFKELNKQYISPITAAIHYDEDSTQIQLENRTKWYYKLNPLVEAAEPFTIEINSGSNTITLRKKRDVPFGIGVTEPLAISSLPMDISADTLQFTPRLL